MSNGVVTMNAAMEAEHSGRNWAEIGVGLATAVALIAMYVAGIWAVWVIVAALV